MSDTPLTKPQKLEKLWALAPMMIEGTPHAKEIGMKFIAIDIGKVTMSLPYNPKLIGDADTRVIAGGAVTTLLDQASGLAATSAFDDPMPVATLDLRIDYMRAAKPNETIIAQAHCYKVTKHVAFVRAIAHDGDSDDPIATSQASFMTTPPPKKKSDAPKENVQAEAQKK